MLSSAIDIHDIAAGVDRKQLTHIKNRFLTLNEQRHQRTCASLSERQQEFVALLPLLFHVNHPMLPGYISHQTPAGIYNFKPDKNCLRLAKTWARSFTYKRDLVTTKADLEALFIMGSVGTIAQSDSSDLDIWVCHNDSLSPKALADLQLKCQRISLWAEQSIHLEAHFFLMSAKNFSAQHTAVLSSEGSGSAQHFLLLDEFYRTALWLAGKIPLWWFVPASQEQHYTIYTHELLNKRFIRSQDVIDFGGLATIPANEFLGAGIWQLYKGIEAPYKSALKLLLLETYASQNNNEPLAVTLKRELYLTIPDANQLDPYVMIYKRLETYLLAHGQLQRLELIRRCFYFKVNKPLTCHRSSQEKSWQRLLLETLVAQWQWPNHQLHMLDQRLQWKAPQVIAERTLLVNELSNSYRLLTELHKESDTLAAISNEELMILGRKLHAAFERKAGKIEWINPGISQDLHEAMLFITEERNNEQTHWKIYRSSQQEISQRLNPIEPIKRARNLVELLLWAHCNGISTRASKVEIHGANTCLSNTQQQQLLASLVHWLPLPLAPVAHDQFKQAAHITRLLFLFNIGVEPQAELHKKGMQMLSNQRDALGYSGFKENLVLTVDIVQLNTWQEVVCRHYGTDALVHSLLHYLRMLPPQQGLSLPELSIRCFSVQHGNTIAQRLEELWSDIIACYYSGIRPANSRYILEMGDEYLLLQFLQQQPHITRYASYEALLDKLGNAQISYSPIVIDRHALSKKTLTLVSKMVTLPGIYVFYQLLTLTSTHAEVIIFDEKGSLFTAKMPHYKQQTLLRPLHRFIRAVTARQSPNHKHDQQAIKIIQFFEVLGKVELQQGYVEARLVSSDISQTHFINITAIAEPDVNGQISYKLYCDELEFSSMEYGDQVYVAVARYILQKRQTSEPYPCYITDLDLSLCRELLAPQSGLQLIHYLQAKAKIEQQLNQALVTNR